MSDEPDYTVQPAPIKIDGAVSSHDLMISDLLGWGDDELTQFARATIAERKAYGLKKYEVILHKDNGRDHNKDALDEALDLAAYLRTWLDHEPGMRALLRPLYEHALYTIVILRNWQERIAGRKARVPAGLGQLVGLFTPHPDYPTAPSHPDYTCDEHGAMINYVAWDYRRPGPAWDSITYECGCVREAV